MGRAETPLYKTYKAMKKKVTIALTYIAVVAVCYYLMTINPLLGFIGIGLGVNILDKVFMKGAK